MKLETKAYSKERVEVYSQEETIIMDNFRVTKWYGTPDFSKIETSLDKGHKNQFDLLSEGSKEGGAPLISFDKIVNTTKVSFAAIQSLKEGRWIEINIMNVIQKAVTFQNILKNMGWRYVGFRSWFEISKKAGILKSKFPQNPTVKKFISLEDWKKFPAQFFFLKLH